MACIYSVGRTYYVRYQVRGQIVRRSLRTSDRKQAEKDLAEIRARIRLGMLGLPVESPEPLMQVLFDEYLPFCKKNRSPRTYRDAKLHIEAKLSPFFGALRPSDIDAKRIEVFVQKMRSATSMDENGNTVPDPYHPRTINLHLETLRKILRRAVENGDIEKMPCQVRLLNVPRSLPKYATPDRLAMWMARLLPEHRERAELSLQTGISDRDLGQLTWTAYDRQHRILTYRRRKTGRDIVIPLTERATAILEGLLSRKNGPHIFQGVASVKRAYMTASRLSGVNITPHMLRHTFATRLLSLGAPVEHLRDLLGHESIETSQIYGKVMPEYLRASISLLDESVIKRSHTKKSRSRRAA